MVCPIFCRVSTIQGGAGFLPFLPTTVPKSRSVKQILPGAAFLCGDCTMGQAESERMLGLLDLYGFEALARHKNTVADKGWIRGLQGIDEAAAILSSSCGRPTLNVTDWRGFP